MKSGFYKQPVTTSSVVGLRRSSKAPKAKLVPRKGHGHCLVVCCQSDPPKLSESQWNHYIWEMCSANQWDALKTTMPAADIGQQKGPNSPWQRLTTCHTTNTPKVEWIGLWCFVSSTMIPDLLPTNHHFFKHLDNYLQGKCFPRVHWIPKHGFLCYRNKQTYFSLAKKHWL